MCICGSVSDILTLDVRIDTVQIYLQFRTQTKHEQKLCTICENENVKAKLNKSVVIIALDT